MTIRTDKHKLVHPWHFPVFLDLLETICQSHGFSWRTCWNPCEWDDAARCHGTRPCPSAHNDVPSGCRRPAVSLVELETPDSLASHCTLERFADTACPVLSSVTLNTLHNRECVTYKNCSKKAQLTQGLRATAPLFQDGRQPPSWILSNRK